MVFFCWGVLWFNTAVTYADEPPQLDYLFPAGGQQGTTVELEIGGYLDPWPVEVWTDCPGLKFEVVQDSFVHTATETESSPGILLYERKGIGKLVVEIDKDAPIGRHLVRVYTPYGTSSPMPFSVGYRQEQSDQEPNDIVDRAQPVSKLPVTINGRFWGDHARQVLSRDPRTGRTHFRSDTDTYAVTLEAGQWLIAATEAYALGYAIDTVLDLREANGAKLAHNNDVHFSTYDSFLAYQAEKSGTYFLQVLAFHLQRATSNQKADLVLRDSAVYRLTLSHGPYAQYTYPAAVQRGKKTLLQVYGINLPSPTGVLIHELDLFSRQSLDDHVLVTTPDFENPLRLGDCWTIQQSKKMSRMISVNWLSQYRCLLRSTVVSIGQATRIILRSLPKRTSSSLSCYRRPTMLTRCLVFCKLKIRMARSWFSTKRCIPVRAWYGKLLMTARSIFEPAS